jgi:hypothetical protein
MSGPWFVKATSNTHRREDGEPRVRVTSHEVHATEQRFRRQGSRTAMSWLLCNPIVLLLHSRAMASAGEAPGRANRPRNGCTAKRKDAALGHSQGGYRSARSSAIWSASKESVEILGDIIGCKEPAGRTVGIPATKQSQESGVSTRFYF